VFECESEREEFEREKERVADTNKTFQLTARKAAKGEHTNTLTDSLSKIGRENEKGYCCCWDWELSNWQMMIISSVACPTRLSGAKSL